MTNRDDVVEALKTIEDPELFLDIYFLGLIYGIDVDGPQVNITMTFTSPMCPAGPEILEQVKTKVEALPDVEQCSIQVTFNPPWQPNEEVRGLLGLE